MTQSTTQAISSACSRLVRKTVVREEVAANSSALARSRSSDATARGSAARTASGTGAGILSSVMAGLVPAIHVFRSATQDVDARDKPAHDGGTSEGPAARRSLERLGRDVLVLE